MPHIRRAISSCRTGTALPNRRTPPMCWSAECAHIYVWGVVVDIVVRGRGSPTLALHGQALATSAAVEDGSLPLGVKPQFLAFRSPMCLPGCGRARATPGGQHPAPTSMQSLVSGVGRSCGFASFSHVLRPFLSGRHGSHDIALTHGRPMGCACHDGDKHCRLAQAPTMQQTELGYIVGSARGATGGRPQPRWVLVA